MTSSTKFTDDVQDYIEANFDVGDKVAMPLLRDVWPGKRPSSIAEALRSLMYRGALEFKGKRVKFTSQGAAAKVYHWVGRRDCKTAAKVTAEKIEKTEKAQLELQKAMMKW